MTKSKSFYFIMISFIIIILVGGCNSMNKGRRLKNDLTIKDIAFDVNKKSGYSVYIKENSNYIPYLVLTSDYNGNTLVVRKEVLEEDQRFDDNTGYYEDSQIDQFLNSEFLSAFDQEIQDKIYDTDITITAKSSIGIGGTDTESITRKIFLLSCTEVGLFDTSFTGEEGKALKYFKDVQSRIAYCEGMPRSWWLRTAYTLNDTMAWAVFTKGEMGGGGIEEESGIRPAFCFKNTTNIKEKDNVQDGKKGYIISY